MDLVSDQTTHQPAHASDRWRDLGICLLLILATFALYAPSLHGAFVWLDDFMYVVENDAVRTPSLASVRKFFGEVLQPTTVGGYYQPLAMLSLMGDAWLTGGDGTDPFYYHFTNVLWHALNGVLVYLLIRSLGMGRLTAAIVAALFLVHPAQVESISWISQRKSVLATFFSLLSVLSYVAYGRSGRKSRLLVSVLCFLLACLAKPTAMPLPLILILLDFWPLRRSVLKCLVEKLLYLPILVAAAYVSWVSQASSAAIGAPRIDSLAMFGKWAALLSYNTMLYFGNFLWPRWLSPYRDIPVDLSIHNARIIAALAVVALLILVWTFSARKRRSLFVGLTGFLVLISPAIGGVHFSETCVGDRFLYLPMVLLLLPIGVGLEILLKRGSGPGARRGPNQTVLVLCVLTLGTLAVLTHHQQAVWADSRSLWTQIHDVAPDFPNANCNMAYLLLEENKPEQALELIQKALRGMPDNPRFLVVLGRAYTRVGRIAEAQTAIEKAISLGLGREEAFGYVSLAEVWVARGELKKARECVGKADQLGWKNVSTLVNIADVAMEVGHNCDASLEFLSLALARNPTSISLRYDLANRFRECGRGQEALAEYDGFLRAARDAGHDVSEYEAAIEHYRRSLAASAPASKNQERP